MTSPPSRRIVIFSGGTAANSLVDVFSEVGQSNNCSLSYVIPISDNGGSSSELIRVFGGPGIGDVRSRLVRLIPSSHGHILDLFNHRLPATPELAAAEFLELLTGNSPLFTHLPTAQSMLIRSILSHLHLEILKRTRPPSSTFNFQSASIGNLFLTGARLFSGSFESAIYLLALIGGVDESRNAVLPVILSNFSHHISAGLANGDVITGQNAISHPSEPTALNGQAYVQGSIGDGLSSNGGGVSTTTGCNEEDDFSIINDHLNVDSAVEDATLPGSLPTLRQPAISFSKINEAPLPARIERIWYINPYGHEMRPTPNPKVLEALQSADAVIYSIGSLYTSIVPSLIVRGVGARIANASAVRPGGQGPRFKILILNGTLDRETPGYTASDFLDAITRACLESQGMRFDGQIHHHHHNNHPSHLQQDHQQDQHHHQSQNQTSKEQPPPPSTLRSSWTKYITHVIHLDRASGDTPTPRVDKDELMRHGVEVLRLYGRTNDGVAAGSGGGGGGESRYDGKALAQALTAILGKRERSEKARRRNTLDQF